MWFWQHPAALEKQPKPAFIIKWIRRWWKIKWSYWKEKNISGRKESPEGYFQCVAFEMLHFIHTVVPCLTEQGLIVPLFQWLWGDILSVSPLPDVRMRYFWSNGYLANAIKQHFFYTSAIWMSRFWKLTYGRVILVPSCSFHLSVLSKLFSLFYYSCLMFLLPAVTCSWSSKFMQDQEVAGNHMVN